MVVCTSDTKYYCHVINGAHAKPMAFKAPFPINSMLVEYTKNLSLYNFIQLFLSTMAGTMHAISYHSHHCHIIMVEKLGIYDFQILQVYYSLTLPFVLVCTGSLHTSTMPTDADVALCNALEMTGHASAKVHMQRVCY